MSNTTTPSSRWAADGQPDPHGDRYACERAALTLGNLTDDELANAVFLHGNEQPTMADLAAGKALAGIVYLTAAKDRIRWLSGALADAIAPQPAELAEQQGGWPFVESPGEFTVRLREAIDSFHHSNLLGAVRHVLIEKPPTLAATGKQQVGEVQGDSATYDKAADLVSRLYMARDMQRAGEWSYLFAEAADALAARQPGAQVPVNDECQCENGGVRYSAEGCTCLKCGKRPAWYMRGRRVRITERRRTNYHPDPETFEALCTWHMGEDLEYRKDGETNSRRVNNYRQNLGSVEVIR